MVADNDFARITYTEAIEIVQKVALTRTRTFTLTLTRTRTRTLPLPLLTLTLTLTLTQRLGEGDWRSDRGQQLQARRVSHVTGTLVTLPSP